MCRRTGWCNRCRHNQPATTLRCMQQAMIFWVAFFLISLSIRQIDFARTYFPGNKRDLPLGRYEQLYKLLDFHVGIGSGRVPVSRAINACSDALPGSTFIRDISEWKIVLFIGIYCVKVWPHSIIASNVPYYGKLPHRHRSHKVTRSGYSRHDFRALSCAFRVVYPKWPIHEIHQRWR